MIEGGSTLANLEKEKTKIFYIEKLNAINHDEASGNAKPQSRKAGSPEDIDGSRQQLLDKPSKGSQYSLYLESLGNGPDEPPSKLERRTLKETDMPSYKPGPGESLTLQALPNV